MNKDELVSTMTKKTNLKEKDCESALNAFVDVVSSQLLTYSGSFGDVQPGQDSTRIPGTDAATD